MQEKTLRQWRREKDMTQEQLAKQSGVTARTISYWEESVDNFRHASFLNVESVASVLGIHVADFYLENTSKILNRNTLWPNTERRPEDEP